MIKWTDRIGPSVNGRVRFDHMRYGIELEFERMFDEYPILDHWVLERDASLRNNGVEFISSPLSAEELQESLAEAQEHIERYDLEASWRCGVHTHLNVAYWEWRQLFQHAVLYTLVEPYLFAGWAPGRETSHFCVPMSQNTRLIDAMSADATRLRAGRATRQNLGVLQCSKYAAVNYKPISTQGTIEFRHMPATEDMGRVLHWCDMLGRIVEASHEYDSPEQIITEYEDLGIQGILDRTGLHTCVIDMLDDEDAYIAACLMAGHEPIKWQDLEWNAEDILRFDNPQNFQMDLQEDEINRILDILDGDE